MIVPRPDDHERLYFSSGVSATPAAIHKIKENSDVRVDVSSVCSDEAVLTRDGGVGNNKINHQHGYQSSRLQKAMVQIDVEKGRRPTYGRSQSDKIHNKSMRAEIQQTQRRKSDVYPATTRARHYRRQHAHQGHAISAFTKYIPSFRRGRETNERPNINNSENHQTSAFGSRRGSSAFTREKESERSRAPSSSKLSDERHHKIHNSVEEMNRHSLNTKTFVFKRKSSTRAKSEKIDNARTRSFSLPTTGNLQFAYSTEALGLHLNPEYNQDIEENDPGLLGPREVLPSSDSLSHYTATRVDADTSTVKCANLSIKQEHKAKNKIPKEISKDTVLISSPRFSHTNKRIPDVTSFKLQPSKNESKLEDLQKIEIFKDGKVQDQRQKIRDIDERHGVATNITEPQEEDLTTMNSTCTPLSSVPKSHPSLPMNDGLSLSNNPEKDERTTSINVLERCPDTGNSVSSATENQSTIPTEGGCKCERCNCSFCNQYDWLEHSRYSLTGRPKHTVGRQRRILNKLYEVHTPYNPLDDKEFMIEYEAEMTWVESTKSTPTAQLTPCNLSSLQESSVFLKKMMRETILAFNRRDSIVLSCPSIPKEAIQITLPSCHSFPEDAINIVRLIPGNASCCDCGIGEEIDRTPLLWASVTYGIILCRRCAFQRIANCKQVRFYYYVSSKALEHLNY